MRILFIASTDSYNPELLPLAREAQARGHQVAMLLTQKEEVHNRMCRAPEVETHWWHDFNDYASYDAFVYGNIFNREVCQQVRAQNGLKIGLFFHLVIDDYVLGGENLHADFTLCYGPRLIETQKRNGLVHNFVAVGPPFEPQTSGHGPSEKNLLFLEQHFYPSGDKGKQQLADMLCEVAERHPDYRVTLKPRALESDKNPRHKARHLYQYFNSTPDNLILLREHRDLAREIDRASVVATTFSTAAAPAILKNKPVFFVNGFSMKETQFYNRAMVNRYYKLWQQSGNLVHYSQLADQLEQARTISDELKHSLFFERKQGFVATAIDFIEYAWPFRGYRCEGCNIENYRDILNREQEIDLRDRFNNIEIERFYLLNLVSGFRLRRQHKALVSHLHSLKSSNLSPAAHREQAGALCDKLMEDCVAHLLQHYRQHPVGFKGYYLKHLFKTRNESACDALPASWRIADYYYNKFLFNNTNRERARYYLEKYLNLAKSEDYKLTHLYENHVIRQSEELYTREYG